jgi:hypothetical protein
MRRPPLPTSRSAKAASVVAARTAAPASRAAHRARPRSSRASSPTPAAGSSATTRGGGPATARAKATMRFWPEDREATFRFSRSLAFTSARASRADLLRSGRRLPAHGQRHHDVGKRAVFEEQQRIRAVVADVAPDERQRRPLQTRGVPAREPHRSSVGHAHRRGQFKQRGLARGRRALDDDELAPGNPQGHRVEHHGAVALAADSFQPNHPMIISEKVPSRYFLACASCAH